MNSLTHPPHKPHDRSGGSQESRRQQETTSAQRWPMGERRFGTVNWIGTVSLLEREIRRFLKVWIQTLAAPVVTSALFMTVFTLALAQGRGDVLGHSFIAFLAPGVVMMTVIQNSFANSSSSMTIAKMQGSIVDVLMPPLSANELVFGIAVGGAARGFLLSILCAVVLFPVAGVGLAQPLWALFFGATAALMLALTGLAAGIWAHKVDHTAAITNFVITPLSFLSGTFYEITRLPEPFLAIAHWNPFFYLIDGFRYGALGVSEASPWIGAAVSLGCVAALWFLCQRMVATGYRLKS